MMNYSVLYLRGFVRNDKRNCTMLNEVFIISYSILHNAWENMVTRKGHCIGLYKRRDHRAPRRKTRQPVMVGAKASFVSCPTHSPQLVVQPTICGPCDT